MDESRQIEDILGRSFTRPELLEQALTHSSLAHESGDSAAHNEQLEFLGDAVLGFVVSARLIQQFPGASEGQLSKIKAHLVSATHLHQVAKRLELGRFLKLGRGEEKSGGRAKRALLVDAMEALIAATYLDGGIVAAENFIVRCVIAGELEAGLQAFQTEDHKSALQEYAQARQMPQPRYRVAEQRGPEHQRVFVVEAVVGEGCIASAEGGTKKGAEQAAARAMLAKLQQQVL